MNAEDLLTLVGDFGRFQKLLIFFYLCLMTAVFRGFVVYNDVFLTVTPNHWCTQPPEFNNLSRQNSQFQVLAKDDNHAIKRHECAMSSNFTTGNAKDSAAQVPCKYGFTYDFSNGFYPTVTSELNLVCDKRMIATSSHILFWLLFQCGGPVFGFISDRYGRIPSAVSAYLLGSIAGFATLFPFHWIFYLSCRGLAGFAFSGMVAAGLTLTTEFVGPKWRTAIVLTWATTCTVVNTAFPWLAYVIQDWRNLTIVTSTAFLAVPLSARLLPESLKWLMAQKKTDKAVELLKRMARINKKELTDTDVQKMKNTIELSSSNTSSKATILDLFRTPNLRKTTILVTLCWAGKSCLTLGLTYLSADLSTNFYFSISVGGLAEFVGCVLQILFLEKLGRRGFSVAVLFLSAISLLSTAAIPSDFILLKHAMILSGRTMSSAAFNTAFLYHTELFPTVARAQGIGLRFAIGNSGAMLGPMIASLYAKNEIVPLVIFGAIAIVTCTACVFLPETGGKIMPQSLEDGENFGKDQKILSCFHSSKEEKPEIIYPEKWKPIPDVF